MEVSFDEEYERSGGLDDALSAPEDCLMGMAALARGVVWSDPVDRTVRSGVEGRWLAEVEGTVRTSMVG